MAPLTTYPIETLNPDAAVDRFVLVLALAHNDLKTYEWLLRQVESHQDTSKATSPSAYDGQINGMRGHASRLRLSLIHEVLDSLKRAKKAGWTEDPVLTAAVELLGPEVQADWETLLDAATATSQKGPAFRKWLQDVRNRLTFHYDSPEALGEGFKGAFLTAAPNSFNGVLYASIGETLETTRWYFADAAAQVATTHLEQGGNLTLEAGDYLRRVNQTLRCLIEAYLVIKSA